MEKFEALESIRRAWSDDAMSLGDKIISISTDYYSAGLDLSTTAAHIHATPSELDALLSMGELDEAVISEISEVNPPKTAWTFLSSASDEEASQALGALKANKSLSMKRSYTGIGEYVYYTMIDISGPTSEQRVANLSGDTLKHVLKKGQDFGVISEKEQKFLKSIAGQKKRGKALSEKQVSWLMDILQRLVEKKAITRNSIDGDQDFCDEILDALGE